MRKPIWDDAVGDVRRLSAAGRRTQCHAYHYQFWDGFDHYNAATQLWDGACTGTPLYSSAYARFAAPGQIVRGVIDLTEIVQTSA